MKYITCTDAINNVDVAINPNLVRFIRRATNARVLVVFDDKQSLTIAGTSYAVRKSDGSYPEFL